MSEPSLVWNPAVTDYTEANELFIYRGGYKAEGQDAIYEAWTAWAATSGSADQQAIASTYSGLALSVWIDTNGMPYIDSELQNNGAEWYPHQSGLCVEDITYNFGGFCYFFKCGSGCDNASQTFPPSNGGDFIQVYALTNNQFETLIRSPATDGTYVAGYEIEDALNSAGLQVTGEDYFQVPVCHDDDGDGVFICQQYLPEKEQDADGAPRFNKNRLVEWTSIVGFIDKGNGNYDDFNEIAWQFMYHSWKGATSLITSGVVFAIAAASVAVI